MQEHDNGDLILCNRISIATVETMLKQQYEADFPEQHYDEKNEMSTEDKRFLHFVSSSVHHKDGHYYVRLPTKEENMTMPNNKDCFVITKETQQ